MVFNISRDSFQDSYSPGRPASVLIKDFLLENLQKSPELLSKTQAVFTIIFSMPMLMADNSILSSKL